MSTPGEQREVMACPRLPRGVGRLRALLHKKVGPGQFRQPRPEVSDRQIAFRASAA